MIITQAKLMVLLKNFPTVLSPYTYGGGFQSRVHNVCLSMLFSTFLQRRRSDYLMNVSSKKYINAKLKKDTHRFAVGNGFSRLDPANYERIDF
jgi:hypothetical protein